MPEYGKWFKGITLSRKVQNGFDQLYNCDIHTDIGSLLCQKALEKKSGSIVNKPCYRAVAPNGDTYFFSKIDGDIFKRTQAGVYSFIRTNPNGAHKGAAYYRNYIYYTTDANLGRFDFNVTWNDSFQILESGKPHAIYQFDLILYVTNGNDLAQVDDADVFSSSSLDLPVEHSANALINLGDDILTLSNPGDYINDSAIFRWDTFSDSWSVKDSIKEKGVYAFLDADNYIYVITLSGNVYLYSGTVLEPFSFLRDAVNTSGHQLTTNFKGKPLFANGGRIYSLHRKNRNLDFALCGEYTCSQGTDATIHSIISNGDNLLVSWEHSGTYGIDEIGDNYASAVVVTPRFDKNGVIRVFYDDLSGGSVQIESKLDGSDTWTEHEVIDDSEDFRMVRTVDDMIVKSGAQARITIIPDAENPDTTPVIDKISISNV